MRIVHCIAMLATALAPLPVLAQSVANPLPLELTQDGVTLRITTAGFFGGANETRGMGFDRSWSGRAWSLPGARKSFIVRYQVTRAAPGTDVPGTANRSADYLTQARTRDDATTVRLYSPTGEPIDFTTGSGRAGGEQQLTWAAVDPHWDHVTLEATALDPAAPLEDSGRVEQTLTFDHIPFPAQSDTPLRPNKSVTAQYGTEVTLDQVTTHYQQNAAGQPTQSLDMSFSWVRPDDAPDLRAQIEFSGGDNLLDAHGTPVTVTNWGSQNPTEGPTRITLQNLPQRALDNFSIRIKVREIAPSRRRQASLRHFRSDLKLPPLNTSKSTPSLQVAETTGGANGLLEPLLYLGEPTRRHVVLWVRERDGATAPGAKLAPGTLREWVVNNVAVKDQAGHTLQSWFTGSRMVQGNRQLAYTGWHTDGTLTAPGELSYPITIVWDGAAPPASMTIEATASEVLHQHQFLNLKDIPVPALKTPVDLNAEAVPFGQTPATHGRLIVRRTMRITDPRAFHKLDPGQLDRLRLGGIALLCETMPGDPHGTLRLWPTSSETDTGQSLLDPDTVVVAPGNLLPGNDELAPGAKGSVWWTIFLLPPTHGAKTMQMQLTLDEDVPTGQQATLRFGEVKNTPGP